MSNCHNHQHCIDDALIAAQSICKQQNAKLTELREQVLLLIWKNHKPLGAYTLIEQLSEQTQRRIAPPTVYRTLEFLLDLGLIHRINSLNAYIGCTHPHSHQGNKVHQHNYFLICKKCHHTQELIDKDLSNKIQSLSQNFNFTAQDQWLEITGLCQECS